MEKIIVLVLIAVAVVFIFTGCSAKATEADGKDGYSEISAEEAKKLMDEEEDYIILDVRTADEFAQGHIEGAILIPNDEIKKRAESELKDKNQLILMYCRSGARATGAGKELAKLGYTNVKNFGGIIDWKYDIVK